MLAAASAEAVPRLAREMLDYHPFERRSKPFDKVHKPFDRCSDLPIGLSVRWQRTVRRERCPRASFPPRSYDSHPQSGRVWKSEGETVRLA